MHWLKLLPPPPPVSHASGATLPPVRVPLVRRRYGESLTDVYLDKLFELLCEKPVDHSRCREWSIQMIRAPTGTLITSLGAASARDGGEVNLVPTHSCRGSQAFLGLRLQRTCTGEGTRSFELVGADSRTFQFPPFPPFSFLGISRLFFSTLPLS